MRALDVNEARKKAIYVFLRRDLNPVDRVVQAAHVCLELGRRLAPPDERYRIIVLGVRSHAKLGDVMTELANLGVKCVLFTEPDMDHERTSVATEPLGEDKETAIAALSRYKLLDAAWKDGETP